MAILIQYANGVPGVKFSLDQPEITIGRALTNDISIDDEFVSKNHAVIHLVEDEVTSEFVCILIDNHSTNHTFVNNVKVSAHQLDEKDRIYIGQNEFRFISESKPSSEVENSSISGFYPDYVPELIHTSFEGSCQGHPQTVLDITEIQFKNCDVEDTADTKHLFKPRKPISDLPNEKIPEINNPVLNNPELNNPARIETDDNKRFSRRLSLI